MTIMDNRFAASLLTNKGRTYAFDAAECMVQYLAEPHDGVTVKAIRVSDFSSPGSMTDANNAFFLICEKLPSPMGGNLTAYAHADTCRLMQSRFGGSMFTWKELEPEITTP
jgi:copper chaperone NosL